MSLVKMIAILYHVILEGVFQLKLGIALHNKYAT